MSKIMYMDQNYTNGDTATSIPIVNMNAKFDSTAHMNSMDMTSQEIEDFVDSLDAQGKPSEYRKLLWTNPSPSATFGAQTISLDLSEYDAVDIECYLSAGGMTSVRRTEVGKLGEVGGLGSTGATYTRMATVASAGIAFTEGKNGNTTNNTWATPYAIYGIKYERVAPIQVDASDYVVEQGVDGIWTYRKWESGLYEAWGIISASFAMTTALSPVYYAIGTFDISSLDFTTIKCLDVTGNGTGYYLFTKVEDYSTTQFRLTAFAQRSYTQTVTHHIQIIGTWK